MLSLGVDRRGTYVVSEQVEKAPTYDYACNLTRTAVRINFPEIKSEVFVNLLGYKGSEKQALDVIQSFWPELEFSDFNTKDL